MKLRVPHTPIRVPGFRFAGVRCGLKENRKRDIGLIASDVPAVAAGAFTTNRVKAAPVIIGLERLAGGRLQAIVVNSGNANAYTGRNGLTVARAMCAVVARELRIDEQLVIPSSTGRIGVPLPRRTVESGARAACRQLSPDGFHAALEGMMTTDAFPKFAADGLVIDGREVVIAGMTKGAGMIAPKMTPTGGAHATNLTYVLTDAAVSVSALRRVLQVALPQSFNAIVVDGDTSTNDTIVLMANGVARNPRLTPAARGFPAFCGAVTRLLTSLARMIVKDGEGATKVIDIRVHGARSVRDAERVADAIARSPLCKTAFFGGRPVRRTDRLRRRIQWRRVRSRQAGRLPRRRPGGAPRPRGRQPHRAPRHGRRAPAGIHPDHAPARRRRRRPSDHVGSQPGLRALQLRVSDMSSGWPIGDHRGSANRVDRPSSSRANKWISECTRSDPGRARTAHRRYRSL